MSHDMSNLQFPLLLGTYIFTCVVLLVSIVTVMTTSVTLWHMLIFFMLNVSLFTMKIGL